MTDTTSTTTTRDAIRTAILDYKEAPEIVHAFGVDIELTQPDLRGLLAFKGAENDEYSMARGIVSVCFVPGTSQPVFDEADLNVLMATKYTKEMKKLVTAMNKLLQSDDSIVKEVEDNTKSPSE